MKNIIEFLRLILIYIAIIIICPNLSYSSSETSSNRITIEVPPYLFINSDQRDLRLTFSDYKTGAESNTETVVYTVMGNNMTQSDGAPAVIARLDGSFPAIDFKARVGAYLKQGGNMELGAISSDFVSIGDSETPLARKANSSGDGKLLRGQIEVSYKAVATVPLTAGQYSQQLTLTLTDV